MSDDYEDANWFPRELRDYLSANVVNVGFFSCLATAFVAGFIQAKLGRADDDDVGVAVGFGLALAVALYVRWHASPYRALGLTPVAATLLFAGTGIYLIRGHGGNVETLLVWGGAFVGMASSGQYRRPSADSFPESLTVWQANLVAKLAVYVRVSSTLYWVQAIGVAVLIVAHLVGIRVPASDTLLLFVRCYLLLLAAVLCAWCWLRLFRPFFELCCEPFFRPLYKIRARGPGVKAVPPLGPVLVIANHAAWFDPVFLGEFIPRPITPLMTESFYNIWFIRPILKYVFRVIVVREQAARREAPELQQAIAALGRGECVVLFPEGFLRRKEEMVLRRFAQGVWHILTARPDTPVVACWIEGGWESTFSWRGGPPVKGKRLDFRRPIDVGVNAPEVVPAGVLADPMRTRLHLMNRVSAARTHIGLEPLPPFTLPAEAEPVQSEQSA